MVRVKFAKFQYSKYLARLLGADLSTVYKYFDELLNNQFIRDICLRGYQYARATQSVAKCSILYVITRTIKPELVIETGVGAGASTAFILHALQLNGF